MNNQPSKCPAGANEEHAHRGREQGEKESCSSVCIFYIHCEVTGGDRKIHLSAYITRSLFLPDKAVLCHRDFINLKT